MLVLSRRREQKIQIGDNVTIQVLQVRGDSVRLGITAPRNVAVHRDEVYQALKNTDGTTPEADDGVNG